MKKELAITLIFILLLIPSSIAVDFQLKEQYKKQETLIAKISGTFLEPLQKDNIKFYRRHVEVQPIKDLMKVGDEYFVYALLSDVPDEYSISIEDISYYTEGAQVTEEPFAKNFTIVDEFAEFSIFPGFVTTNNDFFIKAKNLKSTKIEISISSTSESISSLATTSLNPAQEKQLDFNLDDVSKSSLEFLTLSSAGLAYDVPAYLIGNASLLEEEADEIRFDFTETIIDIKIATNSQHVEKIHIQNTGQKDLENITLVISNELLPYVELSLYEINELDAGSSQEFDFYISSPVQEQIITGHLRAVYDFEGAEINKYIPVEVILSQDVSPTNGDGGIPPISPTSGPSPTNCDTNDDCTETGAECVNGICLLEDGKVNAISTFGQAIGWGIVVILLLFVFWFYFKRYRGVNRKNKTSDLLRSAARGKRM